MELFLAARCGGSAAARDGDRRRSARATARCGPMIDDLAAVEHEDLVAVDQRRQTVRDDHHRAAVRHALQIGVDQRLALRIERRGRLVEDHQLGIDDQRAGDGQPLALAAGQVGRAFLDPGLVALRQALDELLGAGEPGRPHRVLEAEAGTPGEDVVLDGAAEQEVVLQHHAEALAQMAQVDLAQIRAVDLHRAGIVAVDAHQQPGDGGLAGARSTDQPEHRAGLDGEADLVERRGLGALVGEGHVLEADRTLELRPQPVGQRTPLGRPVEYPAHLRERLARLLDVLQQAREVHQRAGDATAQHHEADQAAERQRVVRGERDIGADRQHAGLGVFLERHHQDHGPVAELAHLQVELAELGDPLVPFGAAGGLRGRAT